MIELPARIFEGQHALATTEQMSAAGVTFQQERWLVDSGRCERVSPRVLRLVGAPASKEQRLLAAVLDAGPGSALSHTSALAWWGVAGFTLDEIHVTHARDGVHRPRRLATNVHDKVLLPSHHVRILGGVPVVTPARALFDIAGMPDAWSQRVERAVDNAWSRRLASGRTLRAMLDELACRGRPGITLMRELLEPRGDDYIPPASGLEGRVIQILEKDGQPPLRRQVDTGDEVGWIGRVDFAGDGIPLRVEVQSERFHTSLMDTQADVARIDRLEAAGFVVVTVTDVDVWQRPQVVVDKVRDGRMKAAARMNLPPKSRPEPRFRGQERDG